MWRFAAARAPGSSHLKVGLPCQDQFACQTLADGMIVAVVADGAGSAAMPDLGAKTAVDAIISAVSAAIQIGRSDFAAMLTDAATEARHKVLAVASGEGAEPRELASTLLVTVCGPEGGAALQIGDGVIVVSEGGNGWCWLSWPQRGEYANTTNFLTDEDAERLFQVTNLAGRPVMDIALMTDGLQPLALHYASQSVHQPFFAGIFDPLVQASGSDEISHLSTALEGFLASAPVASRTDDDVSLIMATRRPRSP